MRLMRVRFSVRTMMVAVAVAIAAAIIVLWERRERFRRVSLRYEMERDNLVNPLDFYLLLTSRSHQPEQDQAERFRAARPLVEFDHYLG